MRANLSTQLCLHHALPYRPQSSLKDVQTHSAPLRRAPLVQSFLRLPTHQSQVPHHLTFNNRKIRWRLSSTQKARQRKRLKAVDSIVSTVSQALEKRGMTARAVERWKEQMPREEEMLPKDKYRIFDRKVKGYRKGIHSEFPNGLHPGGRAGTDGCWVELPKWTRVSQRINPPGF